ncbi:uncharacterized protein TNIN_98841 [Trichonephila inaurata madagascariensis]|uniref:Uncharacterized protein n=1 Tax=Trichonephila inaurata madagascariensis TaxID=2747483 RepID=A0A8X6WRG4_9ARAC|nr:uncharacterized protein TNIN_98841 [Trichonephila inaurata madagascariensis]
MVEELNVSVEEYNVLNVKQTKGILKLNQTCTLDLKVGSLVRSVRFFILNTDLPYALLGLGSCIAFQLIIDSVKQVVVQKGRNLINFSSSEGSDLSLHINPKNKVKEGIFESEMKNDKTKECSIVKGKKGNCSQVKKKEKINKDEIDVVKNRTRKNNVLKFSNISETDSDNGCTRCQIEVEDNSETKDIRENFELKEILECYEDVRTRLNALKSLDAKVQMFLEDISWVFPGYGKEGLQLRKIEVPTVESEGISDMMPKTFNKNLLNALSDDDEVPFVDDEDGDPNWEEF